MRRGRTDGAVRAVGAVAYTRSRVVVLDMVPATLLLVGHAGAHVLTHGTYCPERVTGITRKQDAPSMTLCRGKG